MNRIIISGNLTHDVSLKTTNSGTNYCTFNIAVQRKFKDNDGNKVTDFFTVTAWKERAEIICKYLAKDKKCLIVGELQTEKYTAKDGGERTAYKIICEEIEFLSPNEKNENSSQGGKSSNGQGGVNKQNEVEDDDLPF
jgi:single-strand DNA-binding protein